VLEVNVKSQTIKQPSTKSAWFAYLLLEFEHTRVGTQLSRSKRIGPLSIQRAFYPEGKDCAHIYLLHPPAGIVSGDSLSVHIKNHDHAHSLVTTPGANRFYKARDDLNIGDPKQEQNTTIELDNKAVCEHFPQETIIYSGACAFNTINISLKKHSVYLGWDISCLGLPHSGKPFSKGSFTQINKISCEGRIIYHDRLSLSANSSVFHHKAGLDGRSVYGTFLAYASKNQISQAELESLITRLREVVCTENAQDKISISQLRQLLVIRYLGEHSEECKNLFLKLWQNIRPLYINKSATLPRIWFT